MQNFSPSISFPKSYSPRLKYLRTNKFQLGHELCCRKTFDFSLSLRSIALAPAQSSSNFQEIKASGRPKPKKTEGSAEATFGFFQTFGRRFWRFLYRKFRFFSKKKRRKKKSIIFQKQKKKKNVLKKTILKTFKT